LPVTGLLALKGLITVSSPEPTVIICFLLGLPNIPLIVDFMGEDRFFIGEFSESFSFFNAFLVDDFLADFLEPDEKTLSGDSDFWDIFSGDSPLKELLMMFLKTMASFWRAPWLGLSFCLLNSD